MFDDAALATRGLALRAAQEADAAFFRTLFETARPDAAMLSAWPEPERRAFLDQQFSFQSTHYARAYPEAARLVIVKDGAPIGRLILDRAADAWCIVDIALLPACRGMGLGTLLLQSVQRAARRAKAPRLSLTVEMTNPARHLYERLGFTAVAEEVPNVAMEWRPAGVS